MAPKGKPPPEPEPPPEVPGWEPPPVNPLNACDAKGEHPLVTAAVHGRIEVMSKLLAEGVSADVQNAAGLSPLMAACQNGHLAVVTFLLRANATVDLTGGPSCCTALMWAARGGFRACCEALIEAGANPGLEDAYGETAASAAHRYETEAKLTCCDFEDWFGSMLRRAAAIEAEPAPQRPMYPQRGDVDIEAYHRSTETGKMLWRPGEWMYQKRPAGGPVLHVSRPRPYSSTGYRVPPTAYRPDVERFTIGPPGYQSLKGFTVLSGESFASQDKLRPLSAGHYQSSALAGRLAVERNTLNPQQFVDDVASTQQSMRKSIVNAAVSVRSYKEQEVHIGNKFPSAPTRIGSAPKHVAAGTAYGSAPVYSSGLQRAWMSTPSAAATLWPMVEPSGLDKQLDASTVWKPSKHSLFTILQKRSDELKPPPEPEPPPPPPPEPPPDPKAKGKGGKEPPKKK